MRKKIKKKAVSRFLHTGPFGPLEKPSNIFGAEIVANKLRHPFFCQKSPEIAVFVHDEIENSSNYNSSRVAVVCRVVCRLLSVVCRLSPILKMGFFPNARVEILYGSFLGPEQRDFLQEKIGPPQPPQPPYHPLKTGSMG